MGNQRSHTPGPWAVESGPSKTMTGEPAEWAITCSKGPVALLYEEDTTGPRYERDANARLIASAPELLTALENALTQLQDTEAGFPESERHESPGATIARVRAAIARATGGDK